MVGIAAYDPSGWSMTVSVYFEEREMDQIKNLVFDLGDVLIQFRWRDFLRNLGVKEEDVERVGA